MIVGAGIVVGIVGGIFGIPVPYLLVLWCAICAAVIFSSRRQQIRQWNCGICRPCKTTWSVHSGWNGVTRYQCGCGHHYHDSTDSFNIPRRACS